MATNEVIQQAKNNTINGTAKCTRHDHGLYTETEVQHDGDHAFIQRTHCYASGGKEGGFFSDDIR